MSSEDLGKEKLWPVLVETVHAMVMFQNHKAYTRQSILQEEPGIAPVELAARLRIPFGEALVILHELAEEKKKEPVQSSHI